MMSRASILEVRVGALQLTLSSNSMSIGDLELQLASNSSEIDAAGAELESTKLRPFLQPRT